MSTFQGRDSIRSPVFTEAIEQLNIQEPKPKVTFIIVSKRHHVRFMPQAGGIVDRSGNVPAGFVADTGVTAPGLFNFYLQSHAGILGSEFLLFGNMSFVRRY